KRSAGREMGVYVPPLSLAMPIAARGLDKASSPRAKTWTLIPDLPARLAALMAKSASADEQSAVGRVGKPSVKKNSVLIESKYFSFGPRPRTPPAQTQTPSPIFAPP